MIREVEQRKLWRPVDHPDGPQAGDCFRACVASIFAVDYEETDGIDGGDSATLARWLTNRYPGVAMVHCMLGDTWDKRESLDSWRQWPTEHGERGYWIASIKSPRIPSVETFDCGCAYDRETGEPTPADPDCEWCHGDPGSRSMGITWGLHAVVMNGRRLAWDPHPERTGKIGPFRSAITFIVTQPGLLTARCQKGPCGEGLVDPAGCYHCRAA